MNNSFLLTWNVVQNRGLRFTPATSSVPSCSPGDKLRNEKDLQNAFPEFALPEYPKNIFFLIEGKHRGYLSHCISRKRIPQKDSRGNLKKGASIELNLMKAHKEKINKIHMNLNGPVRVEPRARIGPFPYIGNQNEAQNKTASGPTTLPFDFFQV